jgi:hypothetical protein
MNWQTEQEDGDLIEHGAIVGGCIMVAASVAVSAYVLGLILWL